MGTPEDAAAEEYYTPPEPTTAVILIAPDEDEAVKALVAESLSILKYAESRLITANADLTSATEDLSLIAKLKKALEGKRKEYIGPIRDQLDHVNTAFKSILLPIEEADRITRGKIMTFRSEQEKKRLEAEALERDALELAKRQAAAHGGEITVDLTPIEKPEAVPEKVYTDLGSSGMRDNWKYEVVDFAALPDEYKLPDTAMLNAIAKRHHDTKLIPGIRFYNEPTMVVNTR